MKRALVLLLIVLVPVLLFASVFQAFRYAHLERRIGELEDQQMSLIEENKRAILALSVLTSPTRIGELAQDDLGLVRIDPSNITEMATPADGGHQ